MEDVHRAAANWFSASVRGAGAFLRASSIARLAFSVDSMFFSRVLQVGKRGSQGYWSCSDGQERRREKRKRTPNRGRLPELMQSKGEPGVSPVRSVVNPPGDGVGHQVTRR